MRPSWSPRSGRSRCTAASARSSPASRSTRRSSRRTSRRSGSARQNLAKQIENVTMFGIPAVVAINSFPTDTPAEVEAIREVALAAGARDAVVATHFVDGGAGAAALAEAVWAATEDGSRRVRAALPGRDAAGREDRDDRDPGLRRRRRRVPARGRGSRWRSSRTLGYGHAADLHGQDAVLAQPRRGAQGPPDRVHGPDPRGPPVGRGRVRHAAVRRDADDARAAVASRAARRSTSTPTGTSSGCSEPAPRGARSSGRGGRREREAERDDDPDHDAQDARAPRRAIDRAERLLGMGVVVMAVVVAMVVEWRDARRHPRGPVRRRRAGLSSSSGRTSAVILADDPRRVEP